ncbi:Hsp70 family protein [Dothidotthia symphoricarpi CBS 119687]|uniref:Hsp70 family protein n=1 Tax=Dothidotthia symphoricarpi CBS 119687 TaxID=1392245 RepID=A0A6A6AGP7_9PLEO|nr:Hsp70 family protein [Dothidotthia symphoricarpi CBS 119687]KAF2130413.1 Hsp70 family protein [Dothidotthia symphoricarpi CBS 119687]
MIGNRLVIGLDYGTTYTGVSFCETSDTGVIGKDIEVVKDWPSRHTKIGTKEKVPSEIAVSDRSHWGALIASNEQRHMWTKLDLEGSQVGEAAKILQELSLSTQGPHEQPVDIVADFLTHVRNHLVQNLDNQYGKELWRTLPITLVVTVPAVWSDAAKDRTLQAIRKAGFNATGFPKLKRTITATEPEAAAIYTIQSLRGSVQDEQFAIGDGFIVCDMGGGTVDLISYRVSDLEPTTLEEATIGSGDQCGGSFVDRGFMKWLERRLGTTDFVKIAGSRSEDIPRTLLSSKLSRMVQDFVLEAKSGFSGTETNYLRLPVPLSAIEDDESRGIVDGEIVITPEDMKEMFEFPLRRTYELLLEQMRQARQGGKITIKYVFMVGGFAESPYIYDKIKSFAESNGIQAIRPAYAWSAVVRGAAAKGLEGDGRAPIKNRKCRRFYGTAFSALFDPNLHDEADAFVDKYDGMMRARNRVEWLLKTGQQLSTSEMTHAKLQMCAYLWPHDIRERTVNLLASDETVAPSSSYCGVSRRLCYTSWEVYTVARLHVDLRNVPKHLFVARSSPSGAVYHQLKYTVEVSLQSSLEFFVTINGSRYGSVTATYA